MEAPLTPPQFSARPDALSALGQDGKFDIPTLMRTLVNGHQPGALCTVDPSGRPHLRWMSTLAFEEFPDLFSLTSPDSQKVLHVQNNPQVQWMFTSADFRNVLNLSGRARVLTETRDLKRIWRMVEDKSHSYFLNHFQKGPGFIVIATHVELIELTTPETGERVLLHT